MGGHEEDENQVRGNWGNKWEYLLTLAGYSIGLGNVWRFPYLCYKNGGGAFLIPYVLMLFAVGIPLFLLESAVGQFSSSGCLTLYNVCPIFKGIGYTSLMVTLIASTYYSVLIAYSIVYLFNSFSSSVPWASCDNAWNTIDCARNRTGDSYWRNTNSSTISISPAVEFFHNYILQKSDGIDEPDGLVWPIASATFFVWVVVFLCIFKGVKVVGKVVWVTTTFPYMMLLVLFIRGVTLPGALDGIYYYIVPDLEKLMQLSVWADAAVQIFFSLGPGFGTLVTMGSFNRFRNNCLKDAVIVPILNCATSIFAGFVVFSVMGFMAHSTNRPVYDVAASGPGLAFIAYPEALALMPLSSLWSVLFFLMLFFLGIDSVFIQIEAMVASIVDEFPSLQKRRSIIAFLSCLLMFLLALFCCSRGGMYVVQLLDNFSATIPIIFACLCEIIVFAYIYGSGKVVRDLEMMTNKPVSYFWYFMWLAVVPIVLLFIFLNTLVNLSPNQNLLYVFPAWSQRLGWLTGCLSMAAVPLYGLYYMLAIEGSFSKASFSKRLASAFSPTPTWGPALESHRADWVEYQKAHPLQHQLLHPRLFPGYKRIITSNTSNSSSGPEVVIPLTNMPEDTRDPL